MSAPALGVQDLRKSYGGRTALDGLSLEVEAGTVTAMLGPNGAGKTTTVEVCEGFRRPDAGSVSVLGLDPQRQGSELRPRIGVMPQEGGLHPSLPAGVMLRSVASFYEHPLPLPALVERLGLERVIGTTCRRLSGGEQRRLSLAIAIVGRPQLAFLDEPTTGLDPQARLATWELIRDLRADGVTVLLTTHDMEEAEHLADQVHIIDRGRLVASGTPDELRAGIGPGLRFEAAAGLPLCGLIHSLPEGVSARETMPGVYAVEGDIDPETVAAVTAWCADRHILIRRLEVRGGTLEGVFLELTGRELR
ncbi:MAG TPA: ABC transporter ATP-binding protein [Candidatus Dormibacteraeota bacterium]|nr:ABC transporter ATP-binding protein [Candidatus Dormibacteraeota bacterium]